MWRRVIVPVAAIALFCVGCGTTAREAGGGGALPPPSATGWESEPATAMRAPDPVVDTGPVAQAPLGRWTLTARAIDPFILTWRNPGPNAVPAARIATTNAFDQPMAFQVRDTMRDRAGSAWLRIRTGGFPNDAEAWVRTVDVRLATVNQRIVIDLSDRRLVRYVGGAKHTAVRIGIGEAATPTRPGTYFVWARVRYSTPGGPYGKLALGLSGFSEVVRLGTSPGRLAIHGTDDPSDRGRAVSLGCIRVYNGEIGRLWSVPMGTPVVIRR